MKRIAIAILFLGISTDNATAQEQPAQQRVEPTPVISPGNQATSPAPSCDGSRPCSSQTSTPAAGGATPTGELQGSSLAAALYARSHGSGSPTQAVPAGGNGRPRCASSRSPDGIWSYTCSNDDETAETLRKETEQRVRELLN